MTSDFSSGVAVQNPGDKPDPVSGCEALLEARNKFGRNRNIKVLRAWNFV